MKKEEAMETRTYYDILGVSRDASLDEITNAKNALAKVYHPDANMYTGIDTTAYMQEILEAYKILSHPDKRKKYDNTLNGQPTRIFRTFTVGNSPKEDTVSFVTFWNSASKLNEMVQQSISLMEQSAKKVPFWIRIFRKLSRKRRTYADAAEQLSSLSMQAIQHISVLKSAEISMNHWNMDAMNWVLIRWGQKQNMDYQVLFAKYDVFLEQKSSPADKLKLRAREKQFRHQLKKLLNCAISS